MPNRLSVARVALVLALVPAAPAGLAAATYVGPAFPSLPDFLQPMDVEDPRDGTDRLFVVERDGRVYVIENDPGVATRTLFLDIADSVTTVTEGGLLSLAFHPDYEDNRFLYVVYTIESPRRTVLARFTADAADPDACDRATEYRILEVPQDYLHHKGGCLAFGADGTLFLSLGDDGQPAQGQDLTRLEGKLLRIDVDQPAGGLRYGIPPDNPFAGNPSGWREEIYAFGFRNPWRFSIDAVTGSIWLGDVGQNSFEEIDIVRRGRNYGWPRMEGTMCYSPSVCDTTGLDIDLPVFEYPHTGGASITGGYVYRGPTQTGLAGRYLYADYITGDIWALDYDGVDPPVNELIHGAAAPGLISSFGEDRDGELYFTSFDGSVYRFFETATAAPTPAPGGALHSLHPNPFHGTAAIEFTVAAPSHAALEVFDVRGRRVAVLVDRPLAAGAHRAWWNGRDGGGLAVAAGVYFCRLTVAGAPAGARRLVLLR
jgi:hypothetical protein